MKKQKTKKKTNIFDYGHGHHQYTNESFFQFYVFLTKHKNDTCYTGRTISEFYKYN